MRFVVCAALFVTACSSGGGDGKSIDAGRTRRQLPPPTGDVRPLPPFSIDPGGIGGYRLGATPEEIYGVMPEPFPHIAILDIAGVLDASVVRCEGDQLLAGGRPDERVGFLAALSPEIARTESGLAVGARRGEVEAAGPALVDPRIARDPGVIVPSWNPGARFLFDADRVFAILLVGTSDPALPPAGPGPTSPPVPPDAAPTDAGAGAAGCSGALPGTELELRAAAQVTQGPATVLAACLTPEGREALVIAGDTITVIDLDHDRPRRVATVEVRGLSWAAPLRRDADRDDVVAVVEDRSEDELVVSLVALRFEGGKLIKLAEEPVYRVTRVSAQWIGAQLADLRLLLFVEDRADGYQVGGVLVHRSGAAVRDVAPLSPATISRRRRTTPDAPDAPSPPTIDAGPPAEAAPPARDAGHDAGS